jgi:transcription elongation factor GreB
MSRWRPPRPKSAPYITLPGYKVLEEELKQLWQKRQEVTAALTAAAAEGDRSENAEYIYRKKELRGIDSRIHYLQKRLPSLTVVNAKPADEDRIFFGAYVTLEDSNGKSVTYRIVGADELNPQKNTISVDSPLAKALLKKTFDDEVIIKNERMDIRYTIIDIEYDLQN